MRIIFISDIHGKSQNLNHIEQIIKQNDMLVILGDLYSRDIDENDKIDEFIEKYKPILIKGNCDSYNSMFEQQDPKKIKIDNLDIYLTHGNKFNYYNTDINGVLVYGHEHIPYIRQKNDSYYICVGSISYPRNDLKETYMIYDNHTFTIYNLNDEEIDHIYI